MDNQNLRNVKALATPQQHAKIRLMREFDPTGVGEVPDPYYGDEKDFQEVFEILDRSVAGFIASMTTGR
jgi:protein-tyrosine phosphatase